MRQTHGRTFALAWVLCCCALALLMGGCGSLHPRGKSSDVITFNISEDPHSLNPILAQSDDERQIGHLSFDLLLDVDEQGKLVPALATQVPTVANGGISRDGRTIIYHLRHGVRWQDGQPLTASDVIFTWQAITDPDNDVQSTQGYDRIGIIFSPDPYTVVVQLKAPWPPAVATFFTYGTNPMPILPAHLLAERGALRRLPFNTQPVGSGPYRLVRFERSQRLVFEANPAYYRGAPKTKTLVVEEVPDPNSSLTMLRTHELDWSLQSPAQRLAMGRAPGMHHVYAPFSGFAALAFNCRRAPFNKLELRRAIAMAIDRKRLSDAITGGQYEVANSDQPQFSWAFDPSVQLPRFDPRVSDAMFDRLGWLRGPDGVRRQSGQPLRLTLTTFPEGDTAVRTAEYVQQMLRDRGVDVRVKKVSVAQFYLPASAGGLLLSGRYDMAYMVWRTGVDPDDSEIVTCRGNANYAGLCDDVLDRLETRALGSTDMLKRREAYFAIQHRLGDMLPYDFLYAPRYSFAARDGLRGFSPTPYSPTWNAFRWRLDTVH